jgi:lipid II:glycine glycyltransferase (peptidoglycan interpeptide bridge formation enzyme)
MAAAGFRSSHDFVRHVVRLDAPLLELKERLHDSMQRSIRRAEREGLVARVSTERDDLRRFFQLQTMTRKKHGLVPQPWRFFDNIHRQFIAAGSGYVLLAEREGQPLAGELLLRFKDTLIDKFNASDPRFLSLRGNHLILPLAFELGLSLGCRELDLGRSDVAADGLRRFKANCAGLEQPLKYFHYPEVDRGLAGASGSMKRRALAFAVRLAPLWALRHAGGLLYRYAA